MVPLETEPNIEVLRAYSILATKEVERLARELAAARQQKTEEGFLSDELRDKLVKLQEMFFGFGRENDHRSPTHHKGQQLLLHGDRQSDEIIPKAGPEKEVLTPKTSFYKMAVEELRSEALSRGFKMSEAADWDEVVGLTQDSVEITVIERTYEKVIHKQQKYRFRPSIGTDKEIIVTAPGPVKLKPGCQYSADFGIAVVTDKYELHLPLERQRRKMEAAGLDVSVKTLYGLCRTVAEHANEVLPLIKEDIFNDKRVAVHLDETTWPIIGAESQSYLWVMSNRSATYFQFEPTRSGKIAEEMLKGYEGAIISDGFSGYNRFKGKPKIIVGNCWAHFRREFYDIRGNYPKQATEILDLIDGLMGIEHRAKTWDELRALRETESAAAAKKIYEWLLEERQKHLPSSGMVKAIDYGLGRWKELTVYIKHLPLPLTNNDAERALRHSVLGRKNFAGSKSIDGADIAATLYTIVESCKKASIQPRNYLKYVIEEHWHKRQTLSPLRYSWMKNGKPARVGQ